jgi:hypothetical protein
MATVTPRADHRCARDQRHADAALVHRDRLAQQVPPRAAARVDRDARQIPLDVPAQARRGLVAFVLVLSQRLEDHGLKVRLDGGQQHLARRGAGGVCWMVRMIWKMVPRTSYGMALHTSWYRMTPSEIDIREGVHLVGFPPMPAPARHRPACPRTPP